MASCLGFDMMPPIMRASLFEAKRLQALEDENRRLKRLLADAMLDNTNLR